SAVIGMACDGRGWDRRQVVTVAPRSRESSVPHAAMRGRAAGRQTLACDELPKRLAYGCRHTDRTDGTLLATRTVNTLQGQFLIASHELRDPNFFHTIVLIVRHGEEGALGLVLNRPTKAQIKQVWEQVSDTPCETEERLYMGGPVEGLLMSIHTQPL